MWQLWYVMQIIPARASLISSYSSFSHCQAVSLGERHTTASASQAYITSLLISLKMSMTMQQEGLIRGFLTGGTSKFSISLRVSQC